MTVSFGAEVRVTLSSGMKVDGVRLLKYWDAFYIF